MYLVGGAGCFELKLSCLISAVWFHVTNQKTWTTKATTFSLDQFCPAEYFLGDTSSLEDEDNSGMSAVIVKEKHIENSR